MPTETEPKKQQKRRRLPWIILCVLIVLAAYTYWTTRQPLPTIKPTAASVQLQPQTPASGLVWPAVGEAAVGVSGNGVLATNGAQKPVPTASTAKLLTALCVLNQKPLQVGQPGPTITLSQADVNLYSKYLAEDGSVVPVTAGEQISEYQMLEAMLLPSANNMADSLAIWAFGSLSNYTVAANQYAKQLGLGDTHVGSDASGFDPSTTSTASDLVRLGEAALQNPVLAQIVGESSASGIPVAGTIQNVNSLLGTDGIVGIKTGNTNQAGGVFISASKTTANGRPVTVITALAGAPTLSQALSTSLPLIRTAQTNFTPIPIVTSGSIVDSYKLPWGGTLQAVAKQNLSVEAWKGTSASATAQLESITTDTPAQQIVGSISTQKSQFAAAQSIPVILAQAPTKPPLWWRFLHPTT